MTRNGFQRSKTKNTNNQRDPTKKSKMPMAKNAERERSRVRSLRQAFQQLQSCLPSVPPDTKLSKLDVLILAANYISLLTHTLNQEKNNEINTKNSSHQQKSDINCGNFDHHEQPLVECNLDCKVYHPIKKWPMRFRLYSMLQEKDKDNVDSPIESSSMFSIGSDSSQKKPPSDSNFLDFNNNNNEIQTKNHNANEKSQEIIGNVDGCWQSFSYWPVTSSSSSDHHSNFPIIHLDHDYHHQHSVIQQPNCCFNDGNSLM